MKKESFCEDWCFTLQSGETRTVTLPHDAMLEQGRSADAPSGRGEAFFLGDRYTYEKKFTAPESWKEQDVQLCFEGVMPNAQVYLNDAHIGGCQYGYSQFYVSLENLNYGASNCLRVEVDNTHQPNSRWYAGGGIYRPVWLLTAPKAHIQPDGVRITTLNYDPAEILVEVAHTGCADAVVQVEILREGQTVATATGEKNTFHIPNAALWDAEHPNLYQCDVTLEQGRAVLDSETVPFGIRKLAWDAEQGLTVNGKTVLLKGGCIHHDNGILGAKSYARSEWRRIRRMKEFGFNAVRSAHNPLCRAALEACDALGMYVMDESWDTWTKAKTPNDCSNGFAERYPTDSAQMVAKDYNHPSVVLYSIGNEVTEPATPEGVELGGQIVETLKALDATRPVTAGINLTLLLLATMENNPLESGDTPGSPQMDSTAFNKMVMEMGKHMTMAAATPPADQISTLILDKLDISGYNYAVSRYANEGTVHPGRIVVGSETYPIDLAETWPLVEQYPYIIGDFMWTAWDYLGEVGVGSWSYDDKAGFDKNYPWLLADTGALDILGNDNAEAGLASVVWGARTTPYIGIRPVNHPGIVPVMSIWRGSNALPSWAWSGCDGNNAEVEVYSAAPEVELLLNGVSLGRKATELCRAVFETKYTPGELKAVAYNADGTRTESILRSATGETRIRITPEGRARQNDILYLDIDLTGENGEVECNRDAQLSVSVTGGELLGFGSANPRTKESYLTGTYRTYYGRAQAVIRVLDSVLTVTVSGEGLESAVLELQV
ncbi:MAG: DUF4982 domain-containing protein [Clostridiales bacterium]|nr:DUF4982 domain-containing protein [Clostridiales bacterium]